MRFLRPIVVAMLGATLAVVPTAMASSHGTSGNHAPKGPRCKHNGISTNAAGHANCRRHRGQTGTTGDPTGTTGDPTGTDTATGDQTGASDGSQSDQPVSTVDSQGDDSQGDDSQGDDSQGDAQD